MGAIPWRFKSSPAHMNEVNVRGATCVRDLKKFSYPFKAD